MPGQQLPRDPNDVVGQFEDASGNAAAGHEDAAGDILVSEASSAAGIVWGSQAVTTVATALPSQACVRASVQNSSASASQVLLGSATGQTWELPVGGAVADIAVANLNLLSVKVASGTATVNWETE